MNEAYFEELKTFSESKGSGLFRLHLRNSQNILHGVADTKILGLMLLNFEGLYNEVARDVLGAIQGLGRTTTSAEERDLILGSHTEVVLNEAASFSIYFRAKRDFHYSEETETGFQYISDEVFGKLNEIIQCSANLDSLNAIKNQYSKGVFGKVKDFAETVFIHNLILDLEYYNASSEYESRKTLLPINAQGIYTSVEKTTFQDAISIHLTGKFTLINTDTGHFTFRQSGGNREPFSGYFSTQIREGISEVNFRNKYDIVVEQTKIDNVGKKRIKYLNKLVSCVRHSQAQSD